MEHFFTGLYMALGFCSGMVAWQLALYFLTGVKTVVVAVFASIFPPKFVNGRGEIVTPSGGTKESTVGRRKVGGDK